MAGIKELKFRHYFTVINGERHYNDEGMLKLILSKLEGKKAYETFHEEKEPISNDLYAFYFGGIIRHECMASNVFASLTEREIHNVLFSEIRSHTVTIRLPDGSATHKSVSDDFHKYTKKDMLSYIEELIPHLQLEYGIHVKEKEKYDDLNKYTSEPTVYKNLKNKHGSYW